MSIRTEVKESDSNAIKALEAFQLAYVNHQGTEEERQQAAINAASQHIETVDELTELQNLLLKYGKRGDGYE